MRLKGQKRAKTAPRPPFGVNALSEGLKPFWGHCGKELVNRNIVYQKNMRKIKCPFCEKQFNTFSINCHISQMIRYENLKGKEKHLKINFKYELETIKRKSLTPLFLEV